MARKRNDSDLVQLNQVMKNVALSAYQKLSGKVTLGVVYRDIKLNINVTSFLTCAMSNVRTRLNSRDIKSIRKAWHKQISKIYLSAV